MKKHILIGGSEGCLIRNEHIIGTQITIKQFGKYIAVAVCCCEMFFFHVIPIHMSAVTH